MNDILAGLNAEQRRAVETIDGPLLILAGAGSGKTRVLTHRIAWMLQNGVRPWNILAVTFTNKAAAEMKARVGALVGELADRILVSTFHSACVRFLRRDIEHLGYRTSFTIFDTDDQLRLIKSILKELGIDPKARPPRGFLSHIDGRKNRLISPDKAAVKSAIESVLPGMGLSCADIGALTAASSEAFGTACTDLPAMSCGHGTTANPTTNVCEITCASSGRRMEEEEDDAMAIEQPHDELPNITRETFSDYKAANPEFAQIVANNPALLKHFEKLSEQLFGQPALAY